MKKRFLSIFLAIFMVVGMLPLSAVPAFAEDEPLPDGNEEPTEPVHEHSYVWNNKPGENGVHTLVCSNTDEQCDAPSKNEECSYENGVCTVCGAVKPVLELEAPVHEHSYIWNKVKGENGVHTLVCSNTDELCTELTVTEVCT